MTLYVEVNIKAGTPEVFTRERYRLVAILEAPLCSYFGQNVCQSAAVSGVSHFLFTGFKSSLFSKMKFTTKLSAAVFWGEQFHPQPKSFVLTWSLCNHISTINLS